MRCLVFFAGHSFVLLLFLCVGYVFFWSCSIGNNGFQLLDAKIMYPSEFQWDNFVKEAS